MHRHSIRSRYGSRRSPGLFFVITLSGPWVFGWFAYVDEQAAHQQPIEVSAYTIQMMRDTLENWQSEFLQLLWQVAGHAPSRRLAAIQGRRRSYGGEGRRGPPCGRAGEGEPPARRNGSRVRRTAHGRALRTRAGETHRLPSWIDPIAGRSGRRFGGRQRHEAPLPNFHSFRTFWEGSAGCQPAARPASDLT